MKSAFFISDVHLRKMASPEGEALLSLLQLAHREADLFVILGDLLDVWVGAGEAFQKEYAPLIDALKSLRSGCRIFYFEGNHDFNLVRFWKDQMGVELFTGPHDFTYGSLRVRAEHGDEINRKDHGYLFLRWFFRTPILKFLMEALPSSLVLKIGQRASHTSRQYTSGLANRSLEIFRSYAQKLRETKEFDLLVTGHSHVEDDFIFSHGGESCRLTNLGSWFDGAHFLKISPAGDIQNIKI